MSRYLHLQAAGLLTWLAQPPLSPAQRVLAGLLALPHSAELVPARLAVAFGLDLPAFARALFELNRSRSLQVAGEVCDHREEFRPDHTRLCQDLQQLAPQAAVLLADDAGLCLAQHGVSPADCSRQAALCHRGPSADFPFVMPLHLGPRRVYLCARTPVDVSGVALLRLARRLIGLQQHGPA